MTPKLESLYHAAIRADNDFQAALVTQFGPLNAGTWRYMPKTHNAATTLAAKSFTDACSAYTTQVHAERRAESLQNIESEVSHG